MKYNSKYFFTIAILAAVLFSCKKETNTFYPNGNAPVLSSSVTSIAPAPGDSLSNVVVFSWTNPKYATDAATTKYIIEIDSSGRDFSKAAKFTVSGTQTDTLTAKQINTILLGFGFAFNVAYNVDVRLVSSYANNNEQLMSNILTLQMTPYKIPPKVAPPSSGELFITGDATTGGWMVGNGVGVPVPTQQFSQIDSVTYGGVFDLVGGNQYLILPVNGDWSHKYAVDDNSITGLSAGGDFGFDLGKNFPAPTTSGKYKIVMDFQQGKFTVTPFTDFLPDSLYITGDATAGGWMVGGGVGVPVPSQQFTRDNSAEFSLTVALNGGKNYLLLPVNGDWSNKFAVADNSVPATGGDFGYNLPSNFAAPAADGNYKIDVNFVTGKFKVTTP